MTHQKTSPELQSTLIVELHSFLQFSTLFSLKHFQPPPRSSNFELKLMKSRQAIVTGKAFIWTPETSVTVAAQPSNLFQKSISHSEMDKQLSNRRKEDLKRWQLQAEVAAFNYALASADIKSLLQQNRLSFRLRDSSKTSAFHLLQSWKW